MKNLLKLGLIIAVLLVLGGCVLVIPSTPGNPSGNPPPVITPVPISNTVTYVDIVSSDGVHGSLYIDGIYEGDIQPYGTLVISNITPGTHTLTLDTLPYTTFTINVTYNGQTINIDWSGNAW